MSDVYSGKLISKLYQTQEQDVLEEILAEMESLASPIFIYPILEVYQKHKNRPYSHYFLSALISIDSPELIKLIPALVKDIHYTKDYFYCIRILLSRNYFDSNVAKIGLDLTNSHPDDLHDWDVELLVSYVSKTDLQKDLISALQFLYQNKKLESAVRITAFHEWIKIEPKKNLQDVINNFSGYKESGDLLKILAKVIIKWKGEMVDKIILLIKETEDIDAIHVIESYEKKKKLQNEKQKQVQQVEVKKEYSNANLIDSILEKRNKLNILSQSIPSIGFSIFPPNENFGFQLKCANNMNSLIASCVHFRSFIQDISPDFENHGLDDAQIKGLIPSVNPNDYCRSLIKLYLFLHVKGFKVDSKMGGIQRLNKLLNILGGHPDDIVKLVKELESTELLVLFQAEDWSGIHQLVLKKYDDWLSCMLSILK